MQRTVTTVVTPKAVATAVATAVVTLELVTSPPVGVTREPLLAATLFAVTTAEAAATEAVAMQPPSFLVTGWASVRPTWRAKAPDLVVAARPRAHLRALMAV